MDKIVFTVDKMGENQFSPLIDVNDNRYQSLINYCKLLLDFRIYDAGTGSVAISLNISNVFDDLNEIITDIKKKFNEGIINSYDEKMIENHTVIIKGYGIGDNGTPFETLWIGQLPKFLDDVSSYHIDDHLPGTSDYHLRDIPDYMMANKSNIKFIILGILESRPDEFYNRATIYINGKSE